MPSPFSAGLSRRSFLLTGTAAVGVPLLAGARPSVLEPLADGPTQQAAFGYPDPDLTSKITRDITFPVDGTVSWTDTYGACRDGCSRYHEGQDLMAQKLTRLVAVRDGEVVARTHESGGNSIYLMDDDGWYYAYLHVNNDTPFTDDGANPIEWAFAPGTTVGSRVERGQFIAYVGDSGNAESAGSHCHFEIRKPTSSGVWHAQAINPKYSLAAAKAPPPKVPPETFDPWDNSRDYVIQQYADFLGREPDDEALGYYTRVLDSGAHNPDWLIQVLLDSDSCQLTAGAVVRLYNAYFGRYPDQSGFDYWVGQLRAGRSLTWIANHFADSSEFRRTFGELTDDGFIDTVYQNVLGRSADSGGRDFWMRRLDSGSVSRGRLMIEFSESSENRRKRRIPTNVVLIYGLMLRVPSEDVVGAAVTALDAGEMTHQQLIRWIRASDEYALRF